MLSREFGWAFRSIGRAFGRTLSAIIVMSVTIFLVGSTLLLGIAGTTFGKTAKERFTIPVQLSQEADETSANNLAIELEELSSVKSVEINSPDSVMEELGEYLGLSSGEILSSIGYNPLQWELVVTPEEPDNIKDLAEEISRYTMVDKVVYEEEVVDKFVALFSLFRWIALGLALLAIMVTAVVISSTIILSISTRKEEIEVMSLVGAPPSVIMSPYIIEGIFYGLIGGGLATVAVWWGWSKFQVIIKSMLPWFNINVDKPTFIIVLCSTLLFGFLIGLITSWKASSTHLKRISA